MCASLFVRDWGCLFIFSIEIKVKFILFFKKLFYICTAKQTNRHMKKKIIELTTMHHVNKYSLTYTRNEMFLDYGENYYSIKFNSIDSVNKKGTKIIIALKNGGIFKIGRESLAISL